jgi:hypothetical protein
MKLLRLFFIIFLLPVLDADAQQSSGTAAGTRPFKEGGSKSFWMGSNYRKEWNTKVSAPIINLATEYGGLTPVKRGGGKQTKSLRMVDAQGREYTIRSIQKYITSKTLPGDLQSEAAADLVADGVSASYPYSGLSVGTLADAAGIPHLETRLVYIGDDPRLGEYRADFSNMLALFEKRLPDSVEKGWDSGEVADKLKDDNDNDVDQHELLKVRILDMFVMDLDRHEDQWIWGAYDNGKGKTYYPIAKDRDQAFYTNQGLLPGMVKWPWLVPQLQGFRPKAKNINRFNFAARNLDRFFLNQLTEADWKQAAEKFVSQMTDAVIESAIDKQPKEVINISGPKIKQILKDRRQYLVAEVMQYYRFISAYVDITSSDKKELFDVTRNRDGSVLVAVYKITKEGQQSTKMYERLFDPQVTKEIRLYGFGGEDKFTIRGGSKDKIKVRMIGGEGEDNFESTIKAGRTAAIYDAKTETSNVKGKFHDHISNDTIVNTYQRISYKYNQTIPFVTVGYNKDDGVFLGASLKMIHHGFRKEPYKSMHEFSVNHAIATKSFNFRWGFEYIGVFGRQTDLVTDIDIKAPGTTSFYGYGSTTLYDKSKPGKFRYHWARYDLGDISVMLRKRFSDKFNIAIGPTYQFFSLDSNDTQNKFRFINKTSENGLNPATLFKNQSYIGGKFSLLVDTRDNKLMPRRGVKWNGSARYLSGMNDDSYESVTQLNTDLTFYINIIPKRIQIVNRVGGGHNFGDFEFYQAQYLGSEDNLRGFRKYRFAGRSKVFNNTELRMVAGKFRTYLFPGSFGFLFFYDTGVVITDYTNSKDKWQSGYGGGFWIAPLNRILLTFTYATSKEDNLPLVSLGWKF